MRFEITLAAVAAVLLTVATPPDTHAQEAPPELLPEDCETAIALSAAPEQLRDGVGLYVLRAEGYDEVRPSQNGFTCIINRDDPHVLKPTCYDTEGTETILPKVLFVGKLLMQGVPVSDINQRVAEGFESGRFISPRRPGIAYMLSNYNRPYNTRTQTLGWFPPHYMFYAPDLTNADVGATRDAIRADYRQPFVAYQGPQGFILVRAEPKAQPDAASLPQCPAWVSQ